mmetsp:Transcript_41480/g.93514  ORF Transcript_41480/g.93514 Transcript_41480/m.93514 type:complete len:207 (+) Transcript_41480:3585-4205(+)
MGGPRNGEQLDGRARGQEEGPDPVGPERRPGEAPPRRAQPLGALQPRHLFERASSGVGAWPRGAVGGDQVGERVGREAARKGGPPQGHARGTLGRERRRPSRGRTRGGEPLGVGDVALPLAGAGLRQARPPGPEPPRLEQGERHDERARLPLPHPGAASRRRGRAHRQERREGHLDPRRRRPPPRRGVERTHAPHGEFQRHRGGLK